MMKKVMFFVISVFVFLSMWESIGNAATDDASSPMEARAVESMLLAARPGSSVQDVYSELGNPDSIEGSSYQWHIAKAGNQVTLILDVIIENSFVQFVSVVEIISTERQTLSRYNYLVKEFEDAYGAHLSDSNVWRGAFWRFTDDKLLLNISASPQQNGTYVIMTTLIGI
jgi:hypothetical protein